MSTITVVSFMGRLPDPVREWYYAPSAFVESLRRLSVEPLFLTKDHTSWQGLVSKCKLLDRALKAGEITSDYIIVSDSFDVLFVDHPEVILQTYLAMRGKHRIIWGAEKDCFSDATLAPLHPETYSEFKYLNSGWGIGETEAFREAFAEMKPEQTLLDDNLTGGKYMNDQDAWMRQMLFGTVPIGLDYRCQLVQNFARVEANEIDMTGPNVRNKAHNTVPHVLHCNGAKEFWGPRLRQHMGL